MSSDLVRNLQNVPLKVKRAVNQETVLAGERVIRHIRQRTARGVSARGRKFAPYARSTAKQKGRSAPVTLRANSIRSMLDTLAATPAQLSADGIARVTVRLTDGRKQRIGRFHQFGTRKMPRREWFGVTVRFAREHFQRTGERVNRALATDRRHRDTITVTL